MKNTNVCFTDLIGKPFSDQIDICYGPDFYSCYGLLVEVYKRFGIVVPKTNIAVCACKQASDREIETHVIKYWKKICDKPNTLLEVPTAFMIRSSDPEFSHHIGIYIGNSRFIHITRNRNVVIDRVYEWKNRIIGCYKFVGVDSEKEL